MNKLKRQLTASEVATLTNICMVAAEKFDEDVKVCQAGLKATDKVHPDSLVTRSGALRIIEQFQRQASQSRKFKRLFSVYPKVNLSLEIIDPDDEELMKEVR